MGIKWVARKDEAIYRNVPALRPARWFERVLWYAFWELSPVRCLFLNQHLKLPAGWHIVDEWQGTVPVLTAELPVPKNPSPRGVGGPRQHGAITFQVSKRLQVKGAWKLQRQPPSFNINWRVRFWYRDFWCNSWETVSRNNCDSFILMAWPSWGFCPDLKPPEVAVEGGVGSDGAGRMTKTVISLFLHIHLFFSYIYIYDIIYYFLFILSIHVHVFFQGVARTQAGSE